jgi:predicted phage terminase large subunit-like protein
VAFFYASYAEKLSLEHSIKCLRLIQSRWYQMRWGHRFKMIRESAGHIENDKGGYRMASSVDAKATGYGADILVADDPHLVKEAESEAVREDTVKWWSETMPSRLNNRKTGAMIVVMQRVHEGDLSGAILASLNEYVHFCVPMSYVPCKHINAWVGNEVKTFIGDDADDVDPDDIFWEDRRTEDGELLWPGRFPASEVFKLERELGPYAYAGQYQQTPAPRGGGIIRRDWWRRWDKDTAEKNGGVPTKYPAFEYILASLDTAYTEKEENDPSALSIWGVWRDPNGNPMIFLMFCWQDRLLLHDLVSRVGADCKRFKIDRLIIEDKAAGHSVSQELARLFGSFDFGIELVNPRTGFIKSPDKVARLQTVVHLFAEGLIYAPEKEWADEMITQVALVPRAVHDDLADTCSMALLYLRRAGWVVKKEERAFEIEDETRYRPRAGSLYPV